MQVVGKAHPRTERIEDSLFPVEIIELYAILTTFQTQNKSIGGTVSEWLFKNIKKLRSAMEKTNADSEALELKYADSRKADIDESGRAMVWDLKEDGIVAFIEEREGKKLIVDMKGNPLTNNQARLYPYKVDAEKRKILLEYMEEGKKFEENARKVNLVKIAGNLLENANIPTQGGNPPQLFNMELFYDKLVMSDGNETE